LDILQLLLVFYFCDSYFFFMTPERFAKLERVANARRFDMTVILENVHDPHNIAAVLRTCDAVGIAEIYTINKSVPFLPTVGKRSSSSANKWVYVHPFETVSSCVEAVKAKYEKLYCTHLNSEAVSIYDMNFTTKMALVFGNERDGVTDELRSHCDGNFIIPQIGMISSLNISVACAVTLYESFRQNNQVIQAPSFIAERKALLDKWMLPTNE